MSQNFTFKQLNVIFQTYLILSSCMSMTDMYLHQSPVPHKAAASAVIDYLPLHTPSPVIVFGIEINNPNKLSHN